MAPRKFNVPRSTDEPLPPPPQKKKARPPGLTNAEWKTKVEHRHTLKTDRKGRDKRKKAKDAAEAERVMARLVAVEREKAGFPAPVFPPHAGAGLYLPPGAWGSQASVVSPSPPSFSLSPWAF